MNPPPTIELRRYPSRKLYNKTASSYVRLPEVAEMIRAGASIRVEDTETGEDVTRQVLLQIILEQENQSERALLSADVLTDMIRIHQSKASEVMTGLFEQSVAFLRAQQERLAEQVTQVSSAVAATATASPWAMFDPGQLGDLQRDYQQRMASFWGIDARNRRAANDPAAPARSDSDAQEIAELRARLDELERKMSGR